MDLVLNGSAAPGTADAASRFIAGNQGRCGRRMPCFWHISARHSAVGRVRPVLTSS